MPTKKAAGNGITIPEFKRYYTAADPVSETPAMFNPFRVSLAKTGNNGTISLVHKTDEVVTLKDTAEVIFLFFPKITQAKKVLIEEGKDDQHLEFSYDKDGWCTAGYRYSDSYFTRQQDPRVRTRLMKEAYLLFKDPMDKEFKLARYKGSIDAVGALESAWRRVHIAATSKHDLVSGTFVVAKIGVQKEKVNKFEVVRFKPDYEILEQLDEDQQGQVIELVKKLKKSIQLTVDANAEIAEEKFNKDSGIALRLAVAKGIEGAVEVQRKIDEKAKKEKMKATVQEAETTPEVSPQRIDPSTEPEAPVESAPEQKPEEVPVMGGDILYLKF